MPEHIPLQPPDLMTPGEVAVTLKVHARTVTRYANAGKLAFERTLGRHRRYHRSSVEAFRNSKQPSERAA
jgi:excisionase family DNA binding protein